MAILGKLLRNKRAGQDGLAWNAPNLAGAETLELSSPDFAAETTIPQVHTSKKAGGAELSPALNWQPVPADTAQLVLVIEDPDAPTPTPFNHGIALLEPAVTSLEPGALSSANAPDGVRLLRSGKGVGYLGPAPIKGHGPHRYVFQIFALGTPVTAPVNGGELASAAPEDVVAACGGVLARGRLDGFYERS